MLSQRAIRCLTHQKGKERIKTMEQELRTGNCILCDFKTQSKGLFKHSKFYTKKLKSASEVIWGRLHEHYEEDHLEIIMEVWMNNQASKGY